MLRDLRFTEMQTNLSIVILSVKPSEPNERCHTNKVIIIVGEIIVIIISIPQNKRRHFRTLYNFAVHFAVQKEILLGSVSLSALVGNIDINAAALSNPETSQKNISSAQQIRSVHFADNNETLRFRSQTHCIRTRHM